MQAKAEGAGETYGQQADGVDGEGVNVGVAHDCGCDEVDEGN